MMTETLCCGDSRGGSACNRKHVWKGREAIVYDEVNNRL